MGNSKAQDLPIAPIVRLWYRNLIVSSDQKTSDVASVFRLWEDPKHTSARILYSGSRQYHLSSFYLRAPGR